VREFLAKSYDKTELENIRYVLRCPQCFSGHVDLWVGGKGGLGMHKCLECGFMGASFIEVEEGFLEELYERLMKTYNNGVFLEKDIRILLESDIESYRRKNNCSREKTILELAEEKGIAQSND
jgi:hypothetical protein